MFSPKRRKTTSIPGLLTFDSLHLPTSLCRLPYVLRQEIIDHLSILVRLQHLTTKARRTWNLPGEFSEWDFWQKIVVSLYDTSDELRSSGINCRLLSLVETHTVGLTHKTQLYLAKSREEGIQRSYIPSSRYLKLVFGYFAHDFTRKPCLIWRHFTCVAYADVSIDGFLLHPTIFWLPLFPIQSLEVFCRENRTPPEFARELTCQRTPNLTGSFILNVSSGSDSVSALRAGLGLFDWSSSRIETVCSSVDIKDVQEMIPGLCESLRVSDLDTPLSGNYHRLKSVLSGALPIGNLPSSLQVLDLSNVSDFSVLRIRGFLRSGMNLRKLVLLLSGINDSPTMNCFAISSALEEFVFQSSSVLLVKLVTNVRIPLDRWAENHEAKRKMRLLSLRAQPTCSCSDSKHSEALSFDGALACVAKLFPNLQGYRNGQIRENPCLVRRHAENVAVSLPQITSLVAPGYLSSPFLMALVAFRPIERLDVLAKLPTTEKEWIDWESVVFPPKRVIVFLSLCRFRGDCSWEEGTWKRFMVLVSRWTLHLNSVGGCTGFRLGDEELRQMKENGLSSLTVNDKEVFRRLWEEEVIRDESSREDENDKQ